MDEDGNGDHLFSRSKLTQVKLCGTSSNEVKKYNILNVMRLTWIVKITIFRF